jgi:hypothetical protein
MEIISSDDGLTMSTHGLIASGGREISASINDVELTNECKNFLLIIADYISKGHVIQSGETLGYGYWTTKAIAQGDEQFAFFELHPEGEEFVPGISLTLRYWQDQHRTCDRAGSVFSPPRIDQLVVVSEGVLEGDFVQGVRYPSPEHMSGWWITTDRYDGNVDTLKTLHAHHVTAKRPDLAEFLALDYGFRFYSDNGEVRFDPKAMT